MRRTSELWAKIQPPLSDLLPKIEATLTLAAQEELRASSCTERRIQRFSNILYGPFGWHGYSCRSRRIQITDFDAAARKWHELHGQFLHGCDSELQIKKLFEYQEIAGGIIRDFANDVVVGVLKKKSAQVCFLEYAAKFSDSQDLITHIVCPLFNVVVPEIPLTFEVAGLRFTLSRPTSKDSRILTVRGLFDTEAALPDTILRLDSNQSSPEIFTQIRNLICCFILYRPGCVDYGNFREESDLIPISISPLGGQGHKKPSSKLVLRLTDQDENPLSEFIAILLPKFSMGKALNRETKVDPISIALQAYISALHESSLWERQVANLVMAIEALLLGGSVNTDLRFRAGTRAGKLLESCGYKPIYIRDSVFRAYEIRSTYVHGGRCSQNLIKKIRKEYQSESRFCQIICDVTRALILVSLCKDRTKEDMQVLIDDAMMDTTIGEQLKTMTALASSLNQPLTLLEPYHDHFDWLTGLRSGKDE